MNELKQAHHMLQDLAIPLEALVTGFRTFSAWRKKPPHADVIEAIRAGWGAVQRRFDVIEYFATAMTFLEARSLFYLLTQLKNDFEATLEDSDPLRLYDLSLQLYQQSQAKLEIIDKLMLKQFEHTYRITEQISRSISDESVQS